MCGIYLTYFNGLSVKKCTQEEVIFNKINILLKKKNFKQIYQISNNYKSDANFLNYFKFRNERILISKIVKKIQKEKEFQNKNSYLLDACWNLSTELVRRYNFVKSHIRFVSDENVVFYKLLHNTVNSINYQEIRGRDSLGIVVNFFIKYDYAIWSFLKKNTLYKKNYIIKKNKKYINFVIIVKTFNIYGSLGDNSKNILKQISKNKYLNFVLSSCKINKFFILAHTRWASVGKIDNKNTHPIFIQNSSRQNRVFAMMNGSIQNYRSFVKEKKNDSDTFAIPNLLKQNHLVKNVNLLKKKLNLLKGIFSIIFFFEEDPTQIFVFKKNNQGLYLGKNKERLVIASDKYALVEETNFMANINNNSLLHFDFFRENVNYSIVK